MRFLRLLLVAIACLGVAWVLDVLLRALVPILVLPPIFLTLGRGLVALGVLVALMAAWTWRPADPSRRGEPPG